MYFPVDLSEDDRVADGVEDAPFVGQNQTILFVDDEEPIRQVARVVLEKMNLKVLIAKDGADALIHAAEHRDAIKAVITDLSMPQIDGVTLASMLRRMMPDVPIVLASGRIDERLSAELATLKVTDRIEKPFSQGDLENVLKRVLATPESART